MQESCKKCSNSEILEGFSIWRISPGSCKTFQWDLIIWSKKIKIRRHFQWVWLSELQYLCINLDIFWVCGDFNALPRKKWSLLICLSNHLVGSWSISWSKRNRQRENLSVLHVVCPLHGDPERDARGRLACPPSLSSGYPKKCSRGRLVRLSFITFFYPSTNWIEQ